MLKIFQSLNIFDLEKLLWHQIFCTALPILNIFCNANFFYYFSNLKLFSDAKFFLLFFWCRIFFPMKIFSATFPIGKILDANFFLPLFRHGKSSMPNFFHTFQFRKFPLNFFCSSPILRISHAPNLFYYFSKLHNFIEHKNFLLIFPNSENFSLTLNSFLTYPS